MGPVVGLRGSFGTAGQHEPDGKTNERIILDAPSLSPEYCPLPGHISLLHPVDPVSWKSFSFAYGRGSLSLWGGNCVNNIPY